MVLRIYSQLNAVSRIYSRALLTPRDSELAVLIRVGERHCFLGNRLQKLFVAVGAAEALQNQFGHLLRAEHGSRAPQHDNFAQFDFD